MCFDRVKQRDFILFAKLSIGSEVRKIHINR